MGQREVLLKDGHCFLCLLSWHCANHCSSNRKCYKCNWKHHQSLCEQATIPNTEGENKLDTVPKTTVAVVKSKANVLLHTAPYLCLYSVNKKSVLVRVLLDNGNQRLYITNDLSARLSLWPIKWAHLVVRVTKEGMQLSLSQASRKWYWDSGTWVYPLQVPIAVDQYPYLQDLELAVM